MKFCAKYLKLLVVVLVGCTAATNGTVQVRTTPQAATETSNVPNPERAKNPFTHKCERGMKGSTPQDYTSCIEAEVAELDGSSPPVNVDPGYKRALTLDGKCARGTGATETQYTACLEYRRNMLQEGKQSVTPPAAAANTEAPATMPLQATSVYIPGAAGAVCETDQNVQLTVTNSTPGYMLGVRTPRAAGQKVPDVIVPLHCDAPFNLMPLLVLNPDGTTETVLAIPPGVTARFVFPPLNGGIGKRNVQFVWYLWNRVTPGQMQVPSQQVRTKTFRYGVPYDGGNEQIIS